MANNVEKFIIDIGFEDKEAVKGLKELLKNIDESSGRIRDKIKRASVADTNELKKQNALLTAQKSLRNKIKQAARMGIDTKSDQASLKRAKTPKTLNDRALALEEKIYQITLKNVEAKEKAGAREIDLLKDKMRLLRKEQTDTMRSIKMEGKARYKQHLLDQKLRRKKHREEIAAINEENKKVVDSLKKEGKERQKQHLKDQRVRADKHKKQLKDIREKHKAEMQSLREVQQAETARAKAAQKARTTELRLARKMTSFYGSSDYRSMLQRTPNQAKQFEQRFKQMKAGGDEVGMENLRSQMKKTTAAMKRHTTTMLSMQTVQNGLRDSTKHLIRSYASLFAIMATATSINRVGQDFESLNSAMLAAMGTQESAAQQTAFLAEMTQRLGLSMLDTADQYTKFTFASKGKLDTDQVNELFNNMSELGLVLGISKERMKLSFTAIQQMMNKTTVNSEELKRQLAESFPGAIGIFARSLKISEEELFAQMEAGDVLAKDVLPLVAKEMKKVATSGGALEIKMKSLRAAQGRFFNNLEFAQKKIFDNGFSEGLANLFTAANDQMKEGTTALKGFGEIFRTVFNIMAGGVRVLTPILDSFLYVVGNTLRGLSDFATTTSGKVVLGLGAIGFAFTKLGRTILKAALFSPLAPIIAAVALIDDLMAMFDGGRVGVLEEWLFGENKDFDLEDITAENVYKFTKLLTEKIREGIADGFDFEFSFDNFFSKLGDGIQNLIKTLGYGFAGILDGWTEGTIFETNFKEKFDEKYKDFNHLDGWKTPMEKIEKPKTPPTPVHFSPIGIPHLSAVTTPTITITNQVNGSNLSKDELVETMKKVNQDSVDRIIRSRLHDTLNEGYKAY